MKKYIAVAAILAFISCEGVKSSLKTVKKEKPSGGAVSSASVSGFMSVFEKAGSTGATVMINSKSNAFNMIYAADRKGIIAPWSTGRTDIAYNDAGVNIIERKFFIAETEMTNSLAAEVLQWAMDNNRLSRNSADHNGTDSKKVRYGGKTLLDIGQSDSNIIFNSAAGKFSVKGGFGKYPAVYVSWYGAVMLCNWLTEMLDGGTGNLVYTGIAESWNHSSTKADLSKKGFRLPLSAEWDFAARYLGSSVPSTGALASEYVAKGRNEGSDALTSGLYWTPGSYASGALKNYTSGADTARAAVYSSKGPAAVASKVKNQLGLYDMSGNVREWCSEIYYSSGDYRIHRGGSWNLPAEYIQLGEVSRFRPHIEDGAQGFRLAKTR